MKEPKRIEVVLPCDHSHGLNSGALPALPIKCHPCKRQWFISICGKTGDWLFREVCRQNRPLTVIA